MKIVAVIPCLNEAKHIGLVVRYTKPYVNEVFVADGGSTDDTVRIATAEGASVRSFIKAKGLGDNLIRALNLVAYGRNKADIIVLLDGDGQHNPCEIPDLLKPILENQADVVMGNRMVQRGMPPYRIFGNGILTAFANFKSKKQFADSMVGFWAIKREALPRLTEPGWGVYTELLIKCRSNGHRLTSVPIQPIYHDWYSDNSTLPPINLGVRLLWFILKWRWKCEVKKCAE